jgi:hypothetical protein
VRVGREIEELSQPVTLVVYTKCPDKWLLTDTETGRVFRGDKSEVWVELKEAQNV